MKRITILISLVAAMLMTFKAQAEELWLPAIFSDAMVLQRDRPVPVWGWAAPGALITIRFAEQTKAATADPDGKWLVTLDPMPASAEQRNMLVTASISNQKSEIKNVLVGEVWLAGGQSNMELPVRNTLNAEKEIAEAACPQLRFFRSWPLRGAKAAKDVAGEWVACGPSAISNTSATAYFFARELQRELKVPVGVIDCSQSGCLIEACLAPEGVAEIRNQLEKQFRGDRGRYIAMIERFRSILGEWISAAQTADGLDKSLPVMPRVPTDTSRDIKKNVGQIYKTRIYPLQAFAICGFIWYQGESNVAAADGETYVPKMKALINGWRKAWAAEDLPFYYVMLAPCRYSREYCVDRDELPRLWEAQVRTLALVTNVGMVVTTDIGEIENIHPRNKQEVGRRLALLALARTYGRVNLVDSGPMFKSLVIKDGQARVAFNQVGSGLATRDNQPLTWFHIAGADRQFIAADARIEGNMVIVSSPQVKAPVAVRFAWGEVAAPNLINREGLPAVPFRTDDWTNAVMVLGSQAKTEK